MLNHPSWQEKFDHYSLDEMKRLENYLGIEIFNGVCLGDKGSAYRKAGPGSGLARAVTDTGVLFGSYHTNVCQFVFGDGSVRGLQTSIGTSTLGLLASRNDGKPINSTEY